MTRHCLRSLIVLGLAFGFSGAARAEDAPAAGAKADAGMWSEDVAASLKKAAAEKKDVLMDFTGSDWCGWCIKLKTEVFDQADFQKDALAKFVFVEMDFPNKKPQSDAVKAQNAEWQKKFEIQGYPTIMLLDSAGRPFAQTGYQAGGPANYIKSLDGMRAVRIARDEKFAAAEKASGVEKAKLLDEGLAALKNDELVLKFYGPVMDQISQLDTDGKIKARYANLRKGIEAGKAFQGKMQAILGQAKEDPEGTIKKLQEAAAEDGLPADLKQKALLVASRVCSMGLKDAARAEQLFDAGVAADPASEMTQMLKANKAKFFPKKAAEPKAAEPEQK